MYRPGPRLSNCLIILYIKALWSPIDNRLDELGTCGKCGYKTQLCSCNSLAVIDHDHIKYGEEEDEFKVYSEKFKNKKIVLAPEQQKKKKGSTYDDDDEDDKPQRNGPKRIGMNGTVVTSWVLWLFVGFAAAWFHHDFLF